jgi:hypothetical protein
MLGWRADANAMLRRLIGVTFLTVVVAACSTQPSPPTAPRLEAVGRLASATVAGPIHTYVLEDGRTFALDSEAVRILFEGGPGSPVVVGTQGDQRFAGVFVHQDGLPADCWLPGIGAVGREWGAAIEIGGVLWSKAPGFKPGGTIPGRGDRYPSSARFCFDGQARVTGVVK